MKNFDQIKPSLKIFLVRLIHIWSNATSKVKKIIHSTPLKNLAIWFFGSVLALVFIYWLLIARFTESTDDAYVKSDVIQMSPKVSGYVVAVNFVENQKVQAGDILAKIDDQDYVPKVDEATADLSISEENLKKSFKQAQIERLMIDKLRAALKAAKAELLKMESQFNRAQYLFLEQAFSKEKLENVTADFVKAKAAFSQANADYQAGLEKLEMALSEVESCKNRLKQSKARFELSKNEVASTIIQSPTDGVVSNKVITIGSYVRPGSPLFSIIDTNSIYVEANFKETQLRKIKPGQKVIITIDAFGSHQFKGLVTSIAPASGAVFSILPPENATGNFTKIIQRVPVRIAIDKNDPLFPKLISGFSAIVKVKLD